MNAKTYNISIAYAVAAISVGLAWFSVPVALIIHGALVLGLTLFAAIRK